MKKYLQIFIFFIAFMIFQKSFAKNDTTSIGSSIESDSTEIDLGYKKIKIETWNLDKKLSDHIGICLTITE